MFVLLSFYLCWEGGGLAVAQACDVADETAFLVGHADFDGGNLVMVGDTDGLSTKLVALLGTRHIHDAVADDKRLHHSGAHSSPPSRPPHAWRPPP